MSRYITKRIFHSICLLFVISILLFSLFKSMPSDPVSSYLGMQSHISVEEKQQMKQQLGLEEPMIKQYAMWTSSFVRMDLGTSYTLKREVKDVLLVYLGNGILLYGSALLMALVLSFYVAKRRALRVGSSHVPMYCMIGNSIPLFLLCLLILRFVGFAFPFLDTSGMGSSYYLIDGYDSIFTKGIDILQHMVLPLLVLVISFSCVLIPYLNQALVHVYKQDYMVLAKAKGLSKKQYNQHAFRNIVVPLLQLIALYLPILVSGSVIIETLFSWPGMGKVVVDALQHQDLYLANACLLIYAITIVSTSLLIDIICAFLNPVWKEGILT